MRNLWTLNWRFFSARKGRAFFTVFGISLGIILIATLQILMGTVENAVEQSLKQVNGNYDMMVGYQTSKSMLSADELSYISQQSGVLSSAPVLYPYLDDLDHPDPKLVNLQSIYIGLQNVPLSYEFSHLRIGSGSFPKAGEVAISLEYAKAHGLKLGSETEMDFPYNGKQKVKVSGIFLLNDKGGDALAVFDLEWLRGVTKNAGKTTAVIIKLDNVGKKEAVASQLRSKIPSIFIDKRDNMDKERANLSGMKPIVEGLTLAAIMASAMIVISTLQISVQERKREMATLRLLGARGIQIGWLVIQESLILGTLSVTLGIGIGICLSYLLQSMAGTLMHVEIVHIIIPWGRVLLSGLGGILLIVVTGFIPAYWASKIPPMEAFQQNESYKEVHGFLRKLRFPITLILIIAVAGVNFWLHGPAWMYLLCGIGSIFAFFIAVPLLLSWLIILLTFLAHPFLRSVGLLAGRNALRQIGKNSQIARTMMLTIMIGLVGTLVLSHIFEQEKRSLNDAYPFDLKIVTSHGSLGGFPNDLYDRLKKITGIQMIPLGTPAFVITQNFSQSQLATNTKVSMFPTKDKGNQLSLGLVGIQMDDVTKLLPIKVMEGVIDQAALRQGGVVLTERDAHNLGYDLGDRIEVAQFGNSSQNEQPVSLKVIGIIEQMPIAVKNTQDFYTDPTFMRDYFGIKTIQSIQIKVLPESSKLETVQRIEELLSNPMYSDILLYNKDQEIKLVQQQFLQLFIILLVTVLMMTCIATLGLVSTITSSVRERSREFAILRAIGSESGQVLRLVMIEGTMITASGGIMGVLSGVILSIYIMLAMGSTFSSMPISSILAPLILSPIIGLIATIAPGIWVARIDMIKTMQNI